MKKITVLVPCYNEENGIKAVIDNLPKDKLASYGYLLDVLVIDNNSTDRTTEVATLAGARVISETKQGKGNAIRTGFYNIPTDTDYVVMLDGDDTYKASEILRLIEPLDNNFSDVVIGSRLGGKIAYGSMKGFNRLGNWLFSFLVRIFYRVNVTDVLTGYFAWKRETVLKLRTHLQSSGFAIEMEMITKMARLGYEIYWVPISYDPRQGESSLRPVQDGSRILSMFVKNLIWLPKVQRIAFVSDAIAPFNVGGKETRLQEISKRLVGNNREVHIYTMKWWVGPKTIVRNGVYLHAICKNYPLYKNDRRSIRQGVMFSLACFKLTFGRFDIVDVDHIPVFPLFTMRLVCWLRGQKMHATWHEVWGKSYWRQYLGNTKGRLAYLLERLSFRLPDVIISNSAHTTNLLKAANVTRPIHTVPLGVDLDSIFAAPSHAEVSDIIFAGRLLEHKGVDLLVEAVALVKESRPDVSCLVVGNGPERPRLEALVERLALKQNVKFYNFLEDSSELYGLMKSSRVLVLPSKREGFGLVAIEANACGLPVVTVSHKDNAAKDLIVQGQNGLIAEVDATDLAKQICKVLDTPALQMVRSIQKEIYKYHWNNVASTVDSLLSQE